MNPPNPLAPRQVGDRPRYAQHSGTGKLTLAVSAAVAEFEADIWAERQRDGIAAAEERGVYCGRPASIDPVAIKAALEGGEAPAALAKRLGVARSTVYRLRDAPA
jgi:DNA invertase Pin-like site-specific DNA recombinase